MESIELLTLNDDGHAIEGPKFPDDIGSTARYLDEGEWPDNERLAHRHKFFRRDEHGEPMPETLIAFLVPDYLLDSGFPSRRALLAVQERMGWSDRLAHRPPA